jgi:hypothetical protein
MLSPSSFDDVQDAQIESGRFSIESLFVSYSFSLDELIAAFDGLDRTSELPEVLKTVVHESTHLYHAMTTPFGFLIYAVRRLQAILVVNTIKSLRERHGVKIRRPLARYILSLPQAVQNDLGGNLSAWYECELFVDLALNTTDALERLLLRPPTAGIPPSLLFRKVQQYLAIGYREQILALKTLRPETPEAATAVPFEQFQPDEFTDDKGHVDRFQLALQIFLEDSNMVSVTESAATVAEFCKTTQLSYADFMDRLPRLFAQQRLGNPYVSHGLRGTIPTQDVQEFVGSYLALCDVCLFGPVLPHHRHFRIAGGDLIGILPFFRWLDLLGVAPKVSPMRSVDDYGRYTDELCHELGWVTPREIAAFTATHHVSMLGDKFEQTYVQASRHRQRYPWIFQDYQFQLAGNNDYQIEFLRTFNFPVIQYRDQTVYQKDKEALMFYTSVHLLRAALRKIMLNKDIQLRMPYRPKNPPEVAFLRDSLVSDLEEIIGYRVELSLT